MNQIAIPESLQFYFNSLENARSIERLIDSLRSKASETDDMDWDDLRQFYQAQLAAFKIQVDYWQFCDDVWRQVWGEPVDGVAGAVETSGEEDEKERSRDYVWESGMYRSHHWRDGNLVTYVGTDTESALIGFYYQSADGDYKSNGLSLSDNWGPIEDDERILKKNATTLRGHSTLDLSMPKEEAATAIAALQHMLE